MSGRRYPIFMTLALTMTSAARASADQAAPAPPATAEADTGMETSKQLLPTDDASTGFWYKPSPDEIAPPKRSAYVPLGVLFEPQAIVGGPVNGGAVAKLQLTYSVATWFGVVAGIQMAQTTQAALGVQLFRYVGYQIPIALVPDAADFSVLFSPNLNIEGMVGSAVIAGDVSVMPLAFRATLSSISTVLELRPAVHVLIGSEPNAFSGVGTNSSTYSFASNATTFGIQLFAGPLLPFNRTTFATATKQSEGSSLMKLKGRGDSDRNSDDDSDDHPKKKKKKRDDSDEDSRREQAPSRDRTALATIGGAG
jgi:hypothetical protein